MGPAVLERILGEFQEDPIYLLDMLQHSALTLYKEKIWEARGDAEKAIKVAQISCRSAGTIACELEAPCGFGRCPHAMDLHVTLLAPSRGSTPRPACSSAPPFSTKDAIDHVIALRGIKPPPAFSAGASRRTADD